MTYPEAKIPGCQFHLGQAVQRKIQEIGLISTYRLSYPFKLFTKTLSALSYVDPIHIPELFQKTKLHEDFPISLHPIFNYFYNNFICGMNSTRFPPALWNSLDSFSVDSLVRTNNAIEGRHSVFKNTFNNVRSSTIVFLDRLIEEEEVIRIKMISASINHSFRRRNKYIIMEQNVLEFLSEHTIDSDDVAGLLELARLLFY